MIHLTMPTVNGSPVAFTHPTAEGVEYALFHLTPGPYQGTTRHKARGASVDRIKYR
jgi:hypothetical protein